MEIKYVLNDNSFRGNELIVVNLNNANIICATKNMAKLFSGIRNLSLTQKSRKCMWL